MTEQGTFVDEELERIATELAAELDADWPERWDPVEHGTDIIGRITEVTPTIMTKHGPVAVVVLQGRSGRRMSVWLTHAVLRNAFLRARPEVGDVVGIRSQGRVEQQEGDPYENYRLVVERVVSTQPPVDWHIVGAQAAQREP